MREATDEVHNWLAIPKVHGSSMQERLAVANLTLHSLADIDDNSRQTLEYIKQEDAMDFEIVMSTSGKLFKELSARQNNIAKMHLDGKDEDMHYENSHRSRSLERTYIQSFSTNFYIICCMLINKAIFMSSLTFKLSMRFLLLSLISPIRRSRKTSSLRLGSEDFDGLSPLLCSEVWVSEALMELIPYGFVAFACACETTWTLLDMNSSTA